MIFVLLRMYLCIVRKYLISEEVKNDSEK